MQVYQMQVCNYSEYEAQQRWISKTKNSIPVVYNMMKSTDIHRRNMHTDLQMQTKSEHSLDSL